jgi:hypothetical protein
VVPPLLLLAPPSPPQRHRRLTLIRASDSTFDSLVSRKVHLCLACYWGSLLAQAEADRVRRARRWAYRSMPRYVHARARRGGGAEGALARMTTAIGMHSVEPRHIDPFRARVRAPRAGSGLSTASMELPWIEARAQSRAGGAPDGVRLPAGRGRSTLGRGTCACLTRARAPSAPVVELDSVSCPSGVGQRASAAP